MTTFILLQVTAPDQEVANRIAQRLVEDRFASSVHFSESYKTLYWWEGQIHHNREICLKVRTRRENLDEVVGIIRALHPYEIAEIFFSEIQPGTLEYQSWLIKYTNGIGGTSDSPSDCR